MPLHPVVDGDVVPAAPIDRIAAGAGGDVDLLVGTNSDEWRLFLVLRGAIDQLPDAVLAGPVEVHGGLCLTAYGLPPDGLTAYRALHPDAGPGDLLAAVQTDWWTRVP